MDDDVVFFAMLQRYNIYFKYVSLHHDILGSHGAKSSTENIYWAVFCDRYSHLLPSNLKENLLQEDGAVKQLDLLYKVCNEVGLKIYLFIDEYDHFTNHILSDAARLEE